MPKEITKPSGNIVKSNRVIESAHDLPFLAQRLLLAVLVQIPPKEPVQQGQKFRVEAERYKTLFQEQNHYKQLQRAANQILGRVIRIYPDETTNEKAWPWVIEVEYIPREAAVVLEFNPKLLSFISDLSKEFTQYKVQHVAGMRSKYGLRVYDLLLQWQCKGERIVDIDWLVERFQLPASYQRVNNLRQRVLQPAIEDINEHSNLQAYFKLIKVGREYRKVQFLFHPKDSQQETETEAQPKQLTREYIARHAKVGESWIEAERRLQGKK